MNQISTRKVSDNRVSARKRWNEPRVVEFDVAALTELEIAGLPEGAVTLS